MQRIGRSDCAGLPPGWKREEVYRRSSMTTGKTDVFYYSPDGRHRVSNKQELQEKLGPGFDLSQFDYRSGKFGQTLKQARRARQSPYNFSTGVTHDPSMVGPVRQSRNPVLQRRRCEVLTNHPDSRVKEEIPGVSMPTGHERREKPKQLFWVKRLGDLKKETSSSGDVIISQLHNLGEMPGATCLVESVVSSLHSSARGSKMTGQLKPRVTIQKNPNIHLDPAQPMVQQLIVTDDDVKKQERKISDVRNQLKIALEECPRAAAAAVS